ncbi:MAG: hypothetical protein D6698_16275 [Gammaproteobacteria bacterium]|nr:MAG: hypothetical protein D6698_16275 [Gammaproteobacteria bacterium]
MRRVRSELRVDGLHYLGRMTTAERNALGMVPAGATVYDTNLSNMVVYDGSNWLDLSVANIVSSASGNSITVGGDSGAYLDVQSEFFPNLSGNVSITDKTTHYRNPSFYEHSQNFVTQLPIAARGPVTVEDSTSRGYHDYVTVAGNRDVVLETSAVTHAGADISCAPDEAMIVFNRPGIAQTTSYRLGANTSAKLYLHFRVNSLPATNIGEAFDIELGATAESVRGITVANLPLWDSATHAWVLPAGAYKFFAYLVPDVNSTQFLSYQWETLGGSPIGVSGYGSTASTAGYPNTVHPAFGFIESAGIIRVVLRNLASQNIPSLTTPHSYFIIEQM